MFKKKLFNNKLSTQWGIGKREESRVTLGYGVWVNRWAMGLGIRIHKMKLEMESCLSLVKYEVHGRHTGGKVQHAA